MNAHLNESPLLVNTQMVGAPAPEGPAAAPESPMYDAAQHQQYVPEEGYVDEDDIQEEI